MSKTQNAETRFEQLSMFDELNASPDVMSCVCMDIEESYRSYLEDVQEQLDFGTWDDYPEDEEFYALGFRAFVQREFEDHAGWCPGSGIAYSVSLTPGGARVLTTDGREMFLSRARIEKRLGL